MASINKVIIVGNLGKDPEIRTFQGGGQVANVTIATTDKWRDKQTGDAREQTEWHRIVFSGGLAGIVGKYLHKGSQIYVEGSLRTRSWEKDGVRQYVTEIRADVMQMLGNRGNSDSTDGGNDGYGSGNSAPAPRHSSAPSQNQDEHFTERDFGDDDIPF
ncbi:single-stranded DNA-binding protein [Giesbergeria anulus]|uniref:Single-stranded DNA-binding protein n=1 Tax=Giesbergeria anulus TaxID=180197 RepID=A0A1H9NKL8_9BURK|nr:single-stranded DNA-binding protein [Giesbergeria anulus]SER36500.1 single-strand binding protein [Giesbergeria anulus]